MDPLTKRATSPWLRLFADVNSASITSPRGQVTKEMMPYHFWLVAPDAQRWCNFPSRRLNVGYTCFEFIWYLIANNADTSITERATIWKYLSERGALQSNYGHYIFREKQFWRVANELARDKDSRRATIVILRKEHYHTNSSDIPCTLGLTFHIRNNMLHMHVTMRSSDCVFGMGSDVPCFTWTHEFMLHYLRVAYPDLLLGHYFHTSYSMHVYERHFGMLKHIVTTPETVERVEEPSISGPNEVLWCIHNPYVLRDNPSQVPEEYAWARWLSEKANGVDT